MATTTGAMTVDALHETAEYKGLTSRQRAWKIETSPRVIAALDLFGGLSPKEKFLRDLDLDIRKAKGEIGRAELRRLQARLLGFDNTEDVALAADVEQFKVGDVVVQRGRQYRVTAVDRATGKPLAATEIETEE